MYRKGDILAFEKRGCLGNLISLFQKVDKSEHNDSFSENITHVAFCISGNEYMEASMFGVRIMPIYKLKNKNVWHLKLKDSARVLIYRNDKEFNSFVLEHLGDRYDYAEIYRHALRIFSRELYIAKENNDLNVCSELCYSMFERMGIQCDIKNSSTGTPSNLVSEDLYKEMNKI